MLYCDFEGYSSIAIGVSNVLGIRMKENFRQPFYSSSMGELWRRWHISLSGWLREYLYYPLGGNRKGEIRKYINMMIIFIASGLWHGANWTFFIWGILNGLFLVMGNILANPRERIAQKVGLSGHPEVQGVLRRIGVYCLYAFTMIFFASDTVGKALQVIAGIFTRFSIMAVLSGELFSLGLGKINLAISIILVIFVLIIDGYCNKKECGVTDIMVTTPTWIRWVCYPAIVSMILFSANLSGQEFIYSQM